MKINPKESVNIITLVEEFFETLNRQCVQHKANKIYEVKLVDSTYYPTQGTSLTPRPCKELRVTVSMLDTNNRITLFDTQYVYNNPAELLKVDYKRKLYRELLYNAVGILMFNLEDDYVKRAVILSEELAMKQEILPSIEDGGDIDLSI